jgi:MscS family membrane protein
MLGMREILRFILGVGDPRLQAAAWVATGLVLAGFADILIRRVITRVVDRTASTVDDAIVRATRNPVALTFVLLGCWYGVNAWPDTPAEAVSASRGVLATIGVVFWTTAGLRVTKAVLQDLSDNHTRYSLVQPRTLPVFQISGRMMVVSFAAYALLLAWRIDVTAWLASAGIIGIAVGFAAQETLANLFAGISIIVDAPYKLGDFLVLDSGERGRVIDIGFRSTRILTEDDIEIILPNAVMAGAKIINETGGPYEKSRLQVPVGVAYGVDVAAVKAMLVDEMLQLDILVRDDPKAMPVVHFTGFGDSSLDLVCKAWIARPETKARALDLLHTAIYQRLQREGVEIPFPQRDVWMRSSE